MVLRNDLRSLLHGFVLLAGGGSHVRWSKATQAHTRYRGNDAENIYMSFSFRAGSFKTTTLDYYLHDQWQLVLSYTWWVCVHYLHSGCPKKRKPAPSEAFGVLSTVSLWVGKLRRRVRQSLAHRVVTWNNAFRFCTQWVLNSQENILLQCPRGEKLLGPRWTRALHRDDWVTTGKFLTAFALYGTACPVDFCGFHK